MREESYHVMVSQANRHSDRCCLDGVTHSDRMAKLHRVEESFTMVTHCGFLGKLEEKILFFYFEHHQSPDGASLFERLKTLLCLQWEL